MSRPVGAARRSGDPRKRAAQASPRDPGPRKRAAVVGALVAVAAVAAVAVVALRPPGGEVDEAARDHAEVACDLTAKAEEAAQMDTSARYAAAVLLLDKAIIESERAATSDAAFADLDEAVQAVHTAGHRGDPRQWRAALDAALTACRASVG